jgi:hypothetical protein
LGARQPSVWHDRRVRLTRWLKRPYQLGLTLVIALGLAGSAGSAEAQLWKPAKKKPAAAAKAKAKSAPSVRKVGKPTKRKPKARSRARKRIADDDPKVTSVKEFDDAPIITILPGNDWE